MNTSTQGELRSLVNVRLRRRKYGSCVDHLVLAQPLGTIFHAVNKTGRPGLKRRA
jgi:hypothetical protein